MAAFHRLWAITSHVSTFATIVASDCENPTWYSAERSVTLHSFDFTKYRLWTSLFRRGTIVNGQIVVCSFDLTEYHL